MAQTTFSGPVKSLRGFVTAGPDSIVNITAETTLTFAAHAGKVIKVNDADGAITLPTIKADSKGASAGDNDPNVNSHLGAVYKFFVGTDSTDCDIKTDGTDKGVNIVTDEIEEKDVAIQMLAVFIDEVGVGCFDYIEPMSKILLGMT